MAPTGIFAVLAVALVATVNASGPQKMANVSPASLGEFPYQASLRIKGQHYCSGAIVSPRHIVTAAYCVADLPLPLTVVTGTISSSDGEIHTPANIIQHERFKEGGLFFNFDIAVITLADNIVFNSVQNKIALPTAPAPAGTMATASGWGYKNASIPTATSLLNKIKMPTISGEQCQQWFSPSIEIYANQICTYRGRGTRVCGGHSGDPLVYNNELIGIVSFGIPCGVGVPDVSTSIYHLLPWLNSIINAK